MVLAARYKKTPLIDLTPRLTRFTTADGIDVPQAQVPAGIHSFRIQLRDDDGRVGGLDFSFQIVK